MLGSVDSKLTKWRPTTPVVLRLAMVAACVPVVAFALAVHSGLDRNDDAVETVGRDATQGITVAQELKADLAELDELAVRALLTDGTADAYNEKRREVHANLGLASDEAPSGAAYDQPLVNIDYALGHYHSLVGDSFAARAAGDAAGTARLYGQAHEVMAGTLLPEADFFDKANTYLLNATYDRHADDAKVSAGLVVMACVVLAAALVALQVLLARKFHRVVNPALVAATVLAVATGVGMVDRLRSSGDDLRIAREQAFDSVHLLARARATAVSAHQAEGHWLLDPDDGRLTQAFDAQARRLYRLPDEQDAEAAATDGLVPEGAGGYLATVNVTDMVSNGAQSSARRSLLSFGDYLAAHRDLRSSVARGDVDGAVTAFDDAARFTPLTGALDRAQGFEQAVFDEHAEAAADATRGLGRINVLAAGSTLALALVGLTMRLREYRG